MQKTLLTILFSATLALVWGQKKIKVGDVFPCAKLTLDTSQYDQSLVVFLPTLAYSCEYANTLTEAFYQYFYAQKAFEFWTKKPRIQLVFFIHRPVRSFVGIPSHISDNIKFIHDEKGLVFKDLGVKIPTNNNDDATLVLLDAKGKVLYLDEQYRAQGERLKPLEHFIKKINQQPLAIYHPKKQDTIKVGQKAPDFAINDKLSLSDLRGNIVLISFYPAAFSGSIEQHQSQSSFGENLYDLSMVSEGRGCGMQISRLANGDIVFNNPKLKTDQEPNTTPQKNVPPPPQPLKISRIMVSESTPALLLAWQNALQLYSIQFANDANYQISQQYNSFNAKEQYNNRVSVILNEFGDIVYIDWNFEKGDENKLNGLLYDLANKP